jgi:quercetin dioxygenase-like cupin family protein
VKRALALLALAACSKGPGADPPRPPPDAGPAAAPADAAEPPDAGEDLAQVRQVAFADVIKRSYPKAQRCWEQAAADDFRVAGTVTLAARFGPGGKLARIDVVADGAGDGVLTACLVQLFTDAEWPAVFEPDSAIEFPLKFEAPAGQYTVHMGDVVPRPIFGGQEWALLTEANTGNPKAGLLFLELPAGTHRPWAGAERTDVLYVVDGAGSIKVAGTTRRLKTDDVVYLSSGHRQFLLTAGKQTALRVLHRRVSSPPIKGKQQVRIASAAKGTDLVIANGLGTARIVFDKATAGDEAASAAVLRLVGSSEVPEHDHPTSTEVLFVLTGSGTMTVAGKDYRVGPETAVQIPPGIKHSFRAAEAVRAIQFYTPSGPEQRFKPQPPQP